MSIEISLNGKTAFVTGGTRGIGKSIVDFFLKADAKVIATGTNKSRITELNKNNSYKNLEYVQLDLNENKNIDDFIKNNDYDIDILVNNAGINIINNAIDISESDFNKLHKINVLGPFKLSQHFGKKMQEKKWGRIINIASIWSEVTRPGRLSYTSSKMALNGITKTLAIEMAEYNILVNSVSPGFTMTELTASTNTKVEISIIEDKIPIKRLANPNEIAGVVLFLSSELNTYTTGQNIIIDGGYTTI